MRVIDAQLITAVEQDNHTEVAKLLFHGADIRNLYAGVDKVNVLEIAVKHEAIRSLPIILKYKPLTLDTYFDNDEYHTPLNYAVDMCSQENKLIMAKALLEAKANPRMSCFAGYTPLHNAALGHNLELINLLLEYNSNPNLVNNNETSCFSQLLYILWEQGFEGEPQELVENRVIECMLPFLENHADPHLCDDYSFESLAAELNFNRVLAALEQTRLYPLHIAASSCQDRTEFINLIDSQALSVFDELDSKGRTPLDIAKKHGNLMTMQVLLRHKKVCERRKEMETNFEVTGKGLPNALYQARVLVADYLTPKELSFFTTATNMHLSQGLENPRKRRLEDESSNEQKGESSNENKKPRQNGPS